MSASSSSYHRGNQKRNQRGNRGGGGRGPKQEDISGILAQLYPQCSGFVDTHAHLHYLMEQQRVSSLGDLRKRIDFGGELFEGVVNVYCDAASMSASFGTFENDLMEPWCFGSFGFHPHSSKWYTPAAEERILECLKHPKAVAWGECGLDYANKTSTPDQQKDAFSRQIRAAAKLDKPLVVHARAAGGDLFEVMKEFMPPEHKVHLHCFSGSVEELELMASTFPNCYFGVTGAVTYGELAKKANLAKKIPIERLLFESDAPYMPPAPLSQGSRSHPGLIPIVAQRVASVLQMEIKDLMIQVRQNTKTFYGI